MILVLFPSDGCVDDVVSNQTNHQFTSFMLIHFMNSARVCWIITRTVFNMYVCLNLSRGNERKQFEKRDKKPKHLRQFFQNLGNFYIYMFFVNGNRVLLVAFIRYYLLYAKLQVLLFFRD